MTAPQVVHAYVWDGSKWTPQTLASGSVSGTVAVSNFPATQPVSATALPLPTGAATEASLGTDGGGESPANGTGIRGWLRSIFDKLNAGLGRTWTLASGTDSVSVGNFPGTQPVSGTVAVSGTVPVSGTVGVNNFPATQPVSVAATLPVSIAATVNTSPIMTAVATSGTAALIRIVAAATVNNTLLKNSAGRVYFAYFSNNSGSTKYAKFYNKATAPVAGTDTPVLTIILPAGVTTKVDFSNIGQYFATGIGVAMTGAFVDSDTTALVANDVIAQIYAI